MTCPCCAEEVPDGASKCPLCGEGLEERNADLTAALAGLAPDPTLAAKVVDWPDRELVRALRQFAADYTPAQRRALLDEANRRALRVGPAPSRSPAQLVKDGCAMALVLGIALLLAAIVATSLR